MSTTPVDPIVEMLINGVWTDITADVRLESADSGGGIKITRGRANESSETEPTQLGLVLNNRLGKYSPRNPTGPHYGQLGRNQPVRVGLSRRSDDFNRTNVDDWGRTATRTLPDNTTVLGERWRLLGAASAYDVASNLGTLQGTTGNRLATFGTYGDADILAKMKISTRDSEWGIVARSKPCNIELADGWFESAASIGQWVATGGTIATTTTGPYEGAQSGVLVTTGSPSQTILRPQAGYLSPVVVTASYRARIRVRVSTSRDIGCAIDWLTSVGGYISTSVTTVTVPANTWTVIEVTGTAPATAAFASHGPTVGTSPVNGTTVLVDGIELQSLTDVAWYSAYITPGGTDQYRIGKVSPGTSQAQTLNMPSNFVANTYYWWRVQITGQRVRMRFWADGSAEPSTWAFRWFDDHTTDQSPVPMTGEVGVIVKDGTGLLTVDYLEVNQWRAHAEIAELPVRWDLSRSDRWVPVAARGVMRRLGQGRKALLSAVSLHLQSYTGSSYGWWPLESDTGEIAGNNIEGRRPASIGLLEFSEPDLSGPLAIPGISGYATLAQDGSYFSASVPTHTNALGKETFLFFFKIPQAPASDILLTTITSTGTARTWRIYIQLDLGVRVEAWDKSGTLLDSAVVALYFNPDHPVGCWLAATLYIKNNGANVDWAFNYHKPGNLTFYSNASSFAGSIGVFLGITFKSSSVHTATGGVSLAQVMHYAGDLPFVTYDFHMAAAAYVGETAGARFMRLTANAGVSGTTMGLSTATEAMGAQLPAKLMELLAECAEVDGGIFMESRDAFELCLRTRASLWNGRQHTLDIDAGHLTSPLDPSDDDQGTRNDVTVRRTGGGFARAIQTSGPLNVNPPESDPDGVGVYDEAPEINFATDSQLQSAANFRRGRGTQDVPRYPTIHADLTATAYQADANLALRTIAIDSGDNILLVNPEVGPDAMEQVVQAYTETIDQYDWDLDLTATPGDVYRVGVVNYTTRVDSADSVTTASFVSGTDVSMTVTSTLLWGLPAAQPAAFPFDILVAGVRLRVASITGNSNPQTMTVQATPINGVIKTIPAGSRVRIYSPWRVGW